MGTIAAPKASVVSQNGSSPDASTEQNSRSSQSDELVIAWAVDATTGQPRYILELDADHRGNQCNCKCPSCDLPLTAVNAGKPSWKRRPHFRHPKGAAREKCIIVAARKAIEAMFVRQQRIILPRRRRSRRVEGLSGHYYDAWVECPAEAVGIADCSFEDEAKAVLTLDDGRRLLVQLVGRGEVTKHDREDDRITARIEIRVDEPAIADMAPADILSRLELSWTNGCWIRHWSDGALDIDAEGKARAQAETALDWLEDNDLPEDLSPAERRETLLHREVKAILERERRIRVPELHAEARWRYANGFVAAKTWSEPATELKLASVELEVPVGRSVPDVVVTWVTEDGWAHSMLIEVTVTNPISDERIERLSSFGLPALEIDIGRMGGVVTRDEFTRLVVDEVAGKRWLYHPAQEEEEAHLLAVLKADEARAIETVRLRQAILNVPASEWAARYLDAIRCRWREQSAFRDRVPDTPQWRQAQADVGEAIRALTEHGYPASLLDGHPLRTVIARILSIHDGTCVEYRFEDIWGVINAIHCDGSAARRWHTLYLIALRAYPPSLTEEHQAKLAQWRGEVIESLQNGEDTYVRETTYDSLIGLLFPEMQPALARPFGTPLYIRDPEKSSDRQVPTERRSSGTAASLRSSLAPSQLDDVDATLVQASGYAAGQGQSPMLFAKDYARKGSGLSVEQIIHRLIERGVAKSRWMWS